MSKRADGIAASTESGAPPSLQLRDLLERAIFYLGVLAITLYPIGALFSSSIGFSSEATTTLVPMLLGKLCSRYPENLAHKVPPCP
jgi:hypothetical protein